MRARELPGAAALGLLASLLGHAAGYPGGHAMGGAYHEALLATASLAGSGAFVILLSMAWAGAGRTLDGSVLAARLRVLLPSWRLLTLAATLWLALGENIEPHHDPASPLLLFAALALASWVVRLAAQVALRFLAGIVIAIRGEAFAPRARSLYRLLLEAAPIPRGLLCARRRYARPPPIAIAAGA